MGLNLKDAISGLGRPPTDTDEPTLTPPRDVDTQAPQPSTQEIAMTTTIMLIHGAWLNSASWQGFRSRYEAKGYSVVVPDWPHDDRTPAELRTAPSPALAHTGQTAIIDH
jgi:pimeloyl-ACP methyl ester carboxylesterase